MEMLNAQTLPAPYLRDRSEQGNHVSQTLGGRHRQHEVHDAQQHTRTTFWVVPPIFFLLLTFLESTASYRAQSSTRRPAQWIPTRPPRLPPNPPPFAGY
jgi:hypothetical protein